MKNYASLLVLLSTTFFCSLASASVYQGMVTSVYPYQDKVYVLVSNGSFGGAPTSCTIDTDGMIFVLDPATTFGKTLLTIAVSAKLSGKMVYATGDASCGAWNPYNGKINEGLIGLDLKG